MTIDDYKAFKKREEEDNNPAGNQELDSTTAVAQWLRASIFRQICMSTFEWRGFESRWCLSVRI